MVKRRLFLIIKQFKRNKPERKHGRSRRERLALALNIVQLFLMGALCLAALLGRDVDLVEKVLALLIIILEQAVKRVMDSEEDD